jgi:acetyltransferase-like isoleucine patch superfamily enzyme
MSFTAPTRVAVVPLHPGREDPQGVRDAIGRLETEPGLGAVVLEGAAVVVHDRLLAWVPQQANEPDGQWVERLVNRLGMKGYVVDGGPGAAQVRRRLGRLRAAARTVRNSARTPWRVRVLQARRRWRRQQFLRRIRWEARLAGGDLVLDVSKDLAVEPGVRIQVRPGRSVLRIGPRCAIGSGVVLRLGGELELVRNVELRYDVALNVKGHLVMHGRNVLGRGTMVHADGTMTFEWGACTSEYVTVLDSHHEFDGSFVHVHDQGIEKVDITIGASTLLGARAMVMPGVHIGRSCLVGAGSVVTKDVPDGWIARGAPAKHVRRVVADDNELQ